jgi:peptidoglycan hydrolase-like protein with peptidoglycan-binding domain
LARIGLDPGPADGMMGAKTRNAIRQFQADAGLLVNGRPTEELRQRLVAVAGRKGPGSAGTETWPQPVPGVVVTDTMLRSAPAADSANEGATKLGAGARVFVDARKGQWLRLRVDERDGRTGWASFPAIKLIRARATARTSPATADTPKSSGGLFSGIADFSRAATGLFSGDNVDSGNSGSGRTTATIGMRGLGAESLASARPRFDQVKLMDKYRADTKAARRHARVAGLTASNVAFLPEPSVQFQPSASPGEDNWEDGN